MTVAALLEALGPAGEEARRGRFAAIVDEDGTVAVTTDGLGTKAALYDEHGRWETAGWDVVAVNANDLAAVGAKPRWFLDHVSLHRADERLEDFARGLSRGAHAAGVSVVGGEVEVIPGLAVTPVVGGTMGGELRTTVADGRRIEAGDALIALPGNGPHCNGIGGIRRAIGRALGARRATEETVDHLIEWVLKPTPIYSMAIAELVEAGATYRGGAHVSGGGWRNLDRLGWRFELEPRSPKARDPIPEPAEFELLRDWSRMSWSEASEVWNMGVGFFVVVPVAESWDATGILAQQHPGAQIVGAAAERL